MKAVILAGGLGTRLSEETGAKPKPMIEIGAKPLLWHIMKIYSAQGIDEFVVCLGYRGYVIKEYFANYYLHMGDGGWINGGFFVLSPEVARYIDGDSTVWEREPMERLARDDQLAAYRHDGFWYAVDTLRDMRHLQELWDSGDPPWKLWE